jgi:hypothetical protein
MRFGSGAGVGSTRGTAIVSVGFALFFDWRTFGGRFVSKRSQS